MNEEEIIAIQINEEYLPIVRWSFRNSYDWIEARNRAINEAMKEYWDMVDKEYMTLEAFKAKKADLMRELRTNEKNMKALGEILNSIG